MLYVIHTPTKLWRYMLDQTRKREDIRVFEVDTFHTHLRILKRILPRFFTKLPLLYLKPRDIKRLRQIKPGDRLLVLGHTSPQILSAINRTLPDGIRKFLYVWNPLLNMVKGEKAAQELVCDYRDMGFEVYTFNPKDSEAFGVNLTYQIYKTDFAMRKTTEPEYDFYFLGYEKDRGIDVRALEKELHQRGFRTLIELKKPGERPLTYMENIDNIGRSKVIIDLVQKGQTGMTLRPLEAVSFQKKLLTNNAGVVSEAYYNPNNILLVDSLPLPDTITEFAASPYVPVPEHTYIHHDINHWIDSFKER